MQPICILDTNMLVSKCRNTYFTFVLRWVAFLLVYTVRPQTPQEIAQMLSYKQHTWEQINGIIL